VSKRQLGTAEVQVLKLFSEQKTSISDKGAAKTLNMHPLKAEKICEALGGQRQLLVVNDDNYK